ncbi:MAG: phosphatase PAP2 family protein [Prevotella sp.]|nr:phosphatase PAP2 family protein [Prevotella sp.]
MKFLKDLFTIEKTPYKGLFALEWAMLAYLLFTSFYIVIASSSLHNMESMLWGRLRVVATTAAVYAVYRMLPCRFTRLVRVVVQMALLSWWYPDIYEMNRILPNLDHVFAQLEQSLFGCQPALLFHQALPWAWFSELMDLGYASYYPMIAFVAFFYFCCRYNEFQRTVFVIMAAFFIYYVVFIFVPVVGPTYYYQAVGLEDIAKGVFPNLQHYFETHQECLPSPGWSDGFFYGLVEDAKAAGERPVAAFPSSHVGISTVLMFLAYRTCNRRLLFCLLPLFVLLCFATVYIQAHYAIDALAGLVTGVIVYFGLQALANRLSIEH